MNSHHLSVLYAGTIVIAAVLASKIIGIPLPVIGTVAVPAGVLPFAISYLCSDLIVEYHGEDTARDVVNGTILTLLVAYTLIYVAIWIPSAPFWENQAAFEAVLGDSASIALASIIGLAIAQHADVQIFAWIRSQTGTGHRYLRNCGSTAISQLLDTTIFITLGFFLFPLLNLGGAPVSPTELLMLIFGQYVVKLMIAGVDTIPFYLITTLNPASPLETSKPNTKRPAD